MSSLVQIETLWSKPIHAGTRTIITQSRVLHIHVPFLRGGIVWNRPLAVLILSNDGRDQVLPVRDVTRLAQLALFASGLAGALLIRLVTARRANVQMKISIGS